MKINAESFSSGMASGSLTPGDFMAIVRANKIFNIQYSIFNIQ